MVAVVLRKIISLMVRPLHPWLPHRLNSHANSANYPLWLAARNERVRIQRRRSRGGLHLFKLDKTRPRDRPLCAPAVWSSECLIKARFFSVARRRARAVIKLHADNSPWRRRKNCAFHALWNEMPRFLPMNGLRVLVSWWQTLVAAFRVTWKLERIRVFAAWL